MTYHIRMGRLRYVTAIIWCRREQLVVVTVQQHRRRRILADIVVAVAAVARGGTRGAVAVPCAAEPAAAAAAIGRGRRDITPTRRHELDARARRSLKSAAERADILARHVVATRPIRPRRARRAFTLRGDARTVSRGTPSRRRLGSIVDGRTSTRTSSSLALVALKQSSVTSRCAEMKWRMRIASLNH